MVKQFIKDLCENESLSSEFLKLLSENNISNAENLSASEQETFVENTVIPFAKQHGYTFGIDDIIDEYVDIIDFIFKKPTIVKLGDGDLDLISGGTNIKKIAGVLLATQLLGMSAPLVEAKINNTTSTSYSASQNVGIDLKTNKSASDNSNLLITFKEIYKNLPEISDQAPFNEVDAIVLSTISYLPWITQIKADSNFTIADWYLQIVDNMQEKPSETSLFAKRLQLLQSAANSPRYRHITITNVQSKFLDISLPENTEKEAEQFHAMTFKISKNKKVIAFRGTDPTMSGWKEDFYMSFSDQVPAQKDAIEYLKSEFENDSNSTIDITGHSKGGNLAVYSTAKIMANHANIAADIGKVYNCDGPGIRKDIFEKLSPATVKALGDKLITIRPQDSVIGRMMSVCMQGKKICVHSNSSNMLRQHDSLTWGITKDFYKPQSEKFILDTPSPFSDLIEEMLENFVNKTTKQDRKVFLDVVFTFMVNNNIKFNAVNVYSTVSKIIYNYAIKGKTVKEVFSIIGSPSKAVQLTDNEKQNFTIVLNTMSDEFLLAYLKRFKEVNKHLGLPKDVTEQIELTLKDKKQIEIKDLAKLGAKTYIKNFLKIYAISEFFSSLFSHKSTPAVNS